MLPTKLSHLANKLVHLRTPLGVRPESKSDHRRESREERLEGADVPDSCVAPLHRLAATASALYSVGTARAR